MKRFFTFAMALLIAAGAFAAENPAVTAKLKQSYSAAQYRSDCGGWYLLSFQKDGQTFYAMADNQGNVVSTMATKYELHPGFISLYTLDADKKMAHDKWELDMKQYEKDMQTYESKKAKYKSDLQSYNAKVDRAREIANGRYKAEQQAAIRRAEAENRRRAQQARGGGLAGAILSGISSVVSTATAASSVKFDPIFNEVLAENGLLTPPSEPYNPKPNKPVEPTGMFYWKHLTLQQPSPYEWVDFKALENVDGVADVKKEGKYGLVDARLHEIIPCTNPKNVLVAAASKDRFIIQVAGLRGLIDNKGTKYLDCRYQDIEKVGRGVKAKSNGKYGIYTLNGKEILAPMFTSVTESNNYLICDKDGNVGVYNGKCEEVYPCQFQSASFMKFGSRTGLLTKVRGSYGLLDFSTGEQLLPNNYASITSTTLQGTTYLMAEKDGKKGLYSTDGIMILPCEFTEITADQGMLKTKNGKKIGLFTPLGIPFIPANKYDWCKIGGTYVEVMSNDKFGIIALNGDELIPCCYESLVYNPTLKAFIGKVNGGFTVVDFQGREAFSPVTAKSISVPSSSSDYLLVQTFDYKKPYGAIDFNGNVIVPFKEKDSQSVHNKVLKAMKKSDIASVAGNKKAQYAQLNSQILGLNQEHIKKCNSFSYFAQNYVERTINEWQRRGEFERATDWQRRVNNDTRQMKVFELTKEAQDLFIKAALPNLPADNPRIVGNYDPDNETYRFHSEYAPGKDLLIKVDMADAQEFKSTIGSIKKKPEFFVQNDRIALAGYSFFLPNGKIYRYSNQASLEYSVANVSYNFDPINLGNDIGNSNFAGGKQTVSTVNFALGTSDVDVQIPVTTNVQKNTFALIIANELYQNEKKVDYAYNDGQVFRDYCIKTLGIPAENLHFRANATLNNMRQDINWLREVANAYNGEAKFVIYYAGHGMPDDATRDAYLLPIDGFSNDVRSGIRLSDVYDELGKMPAENVVVLLDACFSGASRDGQVMASARGVALHPKVTAPSGNMVVFSAASGQETAHPFREKLHGLFTYYLLKKLQETEGNVSLGEITDYVKQEVKRESVKGTLKLQNPTVASAPQLTNWRDLRLR